MKLIVLFILLIIVGFIIRLSRVKKWTGGKPPKFAYVFLMFGGDAYLPGVLTAAYSIKKTKTKHDIVCMVTNDVSSAAINKLKQLGIIVKNVPYLRFRSDTSKLSEKQKKLYTWLDVSYTKWNCLSFIEYSKVLFLDADIVVLKNIDHIFELPAPASSFSDREDKPNAFRRNAKKFVSPAQMKYFLENRKFAMDGGIALLEPNLRHFKGYVKHVEDNQPYRVSNSISGMDEQSISYYMSVLKTGPKKRWYNLTKKYLCAWFHKCKSPYIINFVGAEKPWDRDLRNEYPDTRIWYKLRNEYNANI